jgi:hypothetical protein
MKHAAIVLLTLLTVSPSALAQGRKPAPRRDSGAAAAAKAAEARRVAADRIIEQITKVSNFLYVYGSVVNGIERSDQTAQRKNLPPETLALIEKNKAGVVESIRNLGDGLRRLELDFSADPNLKTYYQHVNKLSEEVDLAANAAAANKYDDAGKQLVSIVEALARALADAR